MKKCILNINRIAFITLLFFSCIGCSSIKKNVNFNDYKNIEPFLNDYLSLSYLDGYIEEYDIFNVIIDSIPNDYFLISIYPSSLNIILNDSESKQYDYFPQAYREINGETFLIDYQYKRPSNKVYNKLLQKNKIDSTYILVEQGKLSEEEGVIIQTFDDSIFAQNYLVKRKFNKLKLIYQWYGGKVIYVNK